MEIYITDPNIDQLLNIEGILFDVLTNLTVNLLSAGICRHIFNFGPRSGADRCDLAREAQPVA